MSWDCPECGDNNADHLIKCGCGYEGKVAEIVNNNDYDTTSFTEPSIEKSGDPYAGFWLRFGATVIDFLFLMVPTALIFILLPKEVAETVMPDGNINITYSYSKITEISIGVLWLLYKSILESSRHQATFGKRALKLVVSDLTGERVSFSTAIFRSWPLWLPTVIAQNFVQATVSLLAIVSCIAIGFTRQKQGFHDKMSKCLVVKRGAKFYYDAQEVYKRGIDNINTGQYDQAISDFSRAIEINPRFPDAYNNRGVVYARGKGQYGQAISDYNKAIEINPKYAEAYNNRAIAYFYQKEYEKSWDDVYNAQSLGAQVHIDFLKALREASGRQK